MLGHIPPRTVLWSKILEWYCEVKLQRAYLDVGGGSNYPPISPIELAREATPLRLLLASGKLRSWIYQPHSGHQHPLEPSAWNGGALWKDAVMDAIEQGILIVDEDGFELIKSEQRSDIPGVAVAQSNIPHFLKLALDIHYMYDLTEDYNFNEEKLIEYIRIHDPEISPTMAERISKLVRGRGPAARGGNYPITKRAGVRDPDPAKPHNGREFPRAPR